MILTLLALVGLIAIPAVTFIAGAVCAFSTLNREAPDLYDEWKRRRATK